MRCDYLWREEKRNPRYWQGIDAAFLVHPRIIQRNYRLRFTKRKPRAAPPRISSWLIFFLLHAAYSRGIDDENSPRQRKVPRCQPMNDSGNSIFPRKRRPRESSRTHRGLRRRAFRPYQWKLRSRKIQLLQPASHGKWRERNERRCCCCEKEREENPSWQQLSRLLRCIQPRTAYLHSKKPNSQFAPAGYAPLIQLLY